MTFTLGDSVGDIGAGGVEVVSESPPRRLSTRGTQRSFSDDIQQLDVVVYKFTPQSKFS